MIILKLPNSARSRIVPFNPNSQKIDMSSRNWANGKACFPFRRLKVRPAGL